MLRSTVLFSSYPLLSPSSSASSRRQENRGERCKAGLELTFGLAQDLVVKVFFLILQESIFLFQICNSLKEINR